MQPFRQVKKKKCKQCGVEFHPFNSLQAVCSPKCALDFNSEKEVKKRVKQMSADLKNHAYYTQALQVVFNTYIRLRDEGKPCISCDTLSDKIRYDAGHYYSVGNYPSLRFNEDNVHRQCSFNCNKNKHGNFQEYTIRLRNRIGQERFEALNKARNVPRKYSIPELKELIEYYKTKIKDLKTKNC